MGGRDRTCGNLKYCQGQQARRGGIYGLLTTVTAITEQHLLATVLLVTDFAMGLRAQSEQIVEVK